MISEIITYAVVGGARSILGYIENILVDGKIDKYEIGKLVGTAVKYVVLGFGFYYGLGLEALPAAGGAVLADFGITAIKKAGTAIVAKKKAE